MPASFDKLSVSKMKTAVESLHFDFFVEKEEGSTAVISDKFPVLEKTELKISAV